MLTGTGIAQLLPVVISPVLTRMYDEEQFAVFGTFLAFVSILSVVSTLRYSHAIVISSDRKELTSTLALCGLLTVGVSVAFILALPVAMKVGSDFESVRSLQWEFYLVPFSGALMSLNLGFYAVLNWSRRYQTMAKGKVFQASVVAVGSLILGAISKFEESGLVISFVLGQLAFSAFLIYFLVAEFRGHSDLFKSVSISEPARKHYKFPFFSLPADLLNTITSHLPLLMIMEICDRQSGGFYSLTNRVLIVPISFIAAGVLDVFRKEASAAFEKCGECFKVTVFTVLGLLSVGIIGFLPVALFGPELFAFIFGEEWRESGVFASFLSVFFAFRLAASPTSYVFYIVGRQKTDLIWQIVLFVGSFVSIYWGAQWNEARGAVLAFSIFYSVMYIVYLGFIVTYSRGRSNR
jgi:O-antigen/teichoic acid export membrane protein